MNMLIACIGLLDQDSIKNGCTMHVDIDAWAIYNYV